MLIHYCRALDPRVGRRDDEELALAVIAWHAELPTTMTTAHAREIAHQLHREGHALTPGAIGRRWDEQRTPLHWQGISTDQRPITTGSTSPAMIAAPPRPQLLPAPTPPPDTIRRTRPPRVPCPWCGATERQHCTTPKGNPLTGYASHPSRRDAAAGIDVSRVARRAEHAPRTPPMEAQ